MDTKAALTNEMPARSPIQDDARAFVAHRVGVELRRSPKILAMSGGSRKVTPVGVAECVDHYRYDQVKNGTT
jgi:hypothetical protein